VPSRTQSYVDTTVGLYDVVTPAVRIGPWLGRACAGLVVLGWLLAWGQYRRTHRSGAGRASELVDVGTETPVEPAVVTPTDRTTG